MFELVAYFNNDYPGGTAWYVRMFELPSFVDIGPYTRLQAIQVLLAAGLDKEEMDWFLFQYPQDTN